MRKITNLIILLVFLLGVRCAVAGEIHDAAKNGDMKKIKKLLKKNPNCIKERDKDGWTPLLHTVFEGKKEAFLFFIESGADGLSGETFLVRKAFSRPLPKNFR